MLKSRFLALGAVALAAAPATAQVKLNGAGATFPNIIYQDWMLTYNKAHPDVQLNYQSIGSGGGIRQFSDGTDADIVVVHRSDGFGTTSSGPTTCRR